MAWFWWLNLTHFFHLLHPPRRLILVLVFEQRGSHCSSTFLYRFLLYFFVFFTLCNNVWIFILNDDRFFSYLDLVVTVTNISHSWCLSGCFSKFETIFVVV